MPIIISRAGVQGDATQLLARLQQLTADLEQVVAGHPPTAADLADAPVIDHWRLAARREPCLFGICRDHPLLRGPEVLTSGVYAFAPELGWARTLSRFYRLGRHAGTEHVS